MSNWPQDHVAGGAPPPGSLAARLARARAEQQQERERRRARQEELELVAALSTEETGARADDDSGPRTKKVQFAVDQRAQILRGEQAPDPQGETGEDPLVDNSVPPDADRVGMAAHRAMTTGADEAAEITDITCLQRTLSSNDDAPAFIQVDDEFRFSTDAGARQDPFTFSAGDDARHDVFAGSSDDDAAQRSFTFSSDGDRAGEAGPVAGAAAVDRDVHVIDTTRPADELAQARGEIERLHAQARQAQEEIEGLRAQVQQAQAELGAVRRRTERDKAEYQRFAKSDTMIRIVPIMDDLERALAHVPDPLQNDPWIAGVAMIGESCRAMLANEGVERVDPVNEPFDPYYHEAVSRAVTADVAENTVITVYQPGYVLSGRVLRPAQVQVAVRGDE